MKIIEPGHIYQLQHLDGSGAGILVFVNREPDTEHEGVQTQEILRALIDRTQHCDACLRWDGNDKIIHHLRMALALHESRAIERKTEKGELKPEAVTIESDGHFQHRLDPRLAPAKSWGPNTLQHGKLPSDLGEPKTTDYCTECGQSPESGTHWIGGTQDAHEYKDPRIEPRIRAFANVEALRDVRDYLEKTLDNTPLRESRLAALDDAITVAAMQNHEAHPTTTPTTAGRLPDLPAPPSTGIFLKQEPDQSPPYKCNVPMCGDSGVCEECRKRGAR